MAGGRRENKMKFLIFLSLILVFTTGILYGDDILLNISACPKTHWTLKYSVTYKDQSKDILNKSVEGEGMGKLLLGEGVVNLKAKLTGNDCASIVVKIRSNDGIYTIPVAVSPEGNFGLRYIENGAPGFDSVKW